MTSPTSFKSRGLADGTFVAPWYPGLTPLGAPVANRRWYLVVPKSNVVPLASNLAGIVKEHVVT